MEEKLLQISYDMELDEISEGFRLFQRKYQLKRCILYSVVYLIALVFGIDFIIKDSSNIWGFVLAGVSLGCGFYCWYRPVQVRKKMLAAISELAEETYISEFYKSTIRITTKILPKEDADESGIADESNETADESGDKAAKGTPSEKEEDVVTTLYFGSDLLDAMENEKLFLLFVNKSLIYIYPKRCLSTEEQDKLREILKSKAIL